VKLDKQKFTVEAVVAGNFGEELPAEKERGDFVNLRRAIENF